MIKKINPAHYFVRTQPGCSQPKNVMELIKSDFLTILPEVEAHDARKLPVCSITVTDLRFDTSRLGYIRHARYKKLNTPARLASTMQNLLQDKYAGTSDKTCPFSLVIVIKDLWIQQTSIEEIKSYRMEFEKVSEITENIPACTAAFDVYFSKDDIFIPVFRLDSIYTGDRLSKNGWKPG